MWVTLLPLTRSVSKTGPTKATVDERASADVAIQRAAMCLDSIRSDAGNGEQANDGLPSFLHSRPIDWLVRPLFAPSLKYQQTAVTLPAKIE